MSSTDQREISEREDTVQWRRQFLRQLAATGAFALWPGLADAGEEWEDGDPLCRVPYTELSKPDGYELTPAFLKSFIGLSQVLTGVAPLDRRLAGEYLERYATHPKLSATLKMLIDAWQAIAPNDMPPSDDAFKQRFMADPPPNDEAKQLTEGVKQIIYLWYVSAFFLPREDDPTKKVWIYGTSEQYRRGLLWSVIQAHAPATPGGQPGHWAQAPIA